MSGWTMASRLLLALTVLLTAHAAWAQELEPRAYTPSPIGTTFVLGGFGRSQGPILLDPSLDVDNVEGDLWIATVGVGHIFGLAGRQARVLAIGPVAWGNVEGKVGGQPERRDLRGLADPRVKFTVGLRGAPALTAAEFARAPRRLVVGASVTIAPPWGQYESTRLINLGYNRWAFKPEVGMSQPVGRWTIDASAGVWLFSTNTAYYPAHGVKTQQPVVALQGHASYSLPHRSWVAVNATWFEVGDTRVDGARNPDLQRNARAGATLSIPITTRQSVKFAYSTGTTTRRGSDFNTFNVTWQMVTF